MQKKLPIGTITIPVPDHRGIRMGQDAVGLITFSDKIEKMLPPKGAHDHLFSILKVLENTRPSGKTSAASVLQDLAASLKRRGLIIDFGSTRQA